MSESFAELLEENIAHLQTRAGSIIDGTVVDIRPDSVVVSAGLKSECFIPADQFVGPDGKLEVEVGDTVEVSLDAIEDGNGETRMSRERAKRIRIWSDLEKAYEENTNVTGTIVNKIKGGFTINLNSIRAFLPGSLVDVRPVRDTAYLENRELEFKIIKIDRRRDNVVVSRRAVLKTEHSAERDAMLKKLSESGVVRGTVKNLTEYGAFLDLGGVDGLLHITDMAWRRIKHPSDVVEVGQEIDVKILSYDQESGRVSLGIKQLTEDPWENIVDRYEVGSKVPGTVTSITDYGCFVEIEDGIEGLVHASEMDWTSRNANPSRVVTLGETVEVMVLEIDLERRRISLGMKQCSANPWEAFAAMYSKGAQVTGTVKSITDFGIFVGLEGGIDGLIHLSDLSWTDPGEKVIHEYRKGNEIEAKVLSVDVDRERVSLGIKQLTEDPVQGWLKQHPKGQAVSCTVTEVEPRTITVEVAEHITGSIPASELADDSVEDARNHVKVGDTLEAFIQSFDRKNRHLSLSVRAKDQAEEKQAVKEYKEAAPKISKSLGGILRDKLVGRKDDDS